MKVVDHTAKLLLTQGALITKTYVDTGATFRTNENMGMYGMSCQYWQPPKLTYMHPGFNPYLTGAGSWWWRNSSACGQCLEVKRGDAAVILVIADYCPECTPKQLDMNNYASEILNNNNRARNYLDLKVRRVSCDWGGAAINVNRYYYLDKGSSIFNWYVIPLYLERPLTSLRVYDTDAYHDKYGRWVLAFKKYKPPTEGEVELDACDSSGCFKDKQYFVSSDPRILLNKDEL
jgi:hypothetical protein